MTNRTISITETPRDGFQGLQTIVPTELKLEYINLLLQCGFDTVEVGSLVSPRAIPQMADTLDILSKLDPADHSSKIAILVASLSGAKRGCDFDFIDQFFYPFSPSETFLYKNIKQKFQEADQTIDSIQNLCVKHNKELIVYFSMGFGNPYGDPWNLEIISEWLDNMKQKGLTYFPFSDIMGNASPELIAEVFTHIQQTFPDLHFGLHLHALKEEAQAKVEAAYGAGISKFDTVMKGMGGCPMTGKELVGNLPLEELLAYCDMHQIKSGIDKFMLQQAVDFHQLHFQNIS